MRHLALAAGVVCAAVGVTSWVTAQAPGMPGQVVGTGYTMQQVGHQLPRVGQPVGQPINIPPNSPMMRPYDPNRPYDVFKGTNIDPRSVVTPPQAGTGSNVFTRTYDQVKSILGMTKTVAPTGTVTPGILRRNRERAAERMWRRD